MKLGTCALTRPSPELTDHGYVEVEKWAETDIAAAASALKRLYENHLLRLTLGQAASESIKLQFPTAAFGKKVEEFSGIFPQPLTISVKF